MTDTTTEDEIDAAVRYVDRHKETIKAMAQLKVAALAFLAGAKWQKERSEP